MAPRDSAFLISLSGNSARKAVQIANSRDSGVVCLGAATAPWMIPVHRPTLGSPEFRPELYSRTGALKPMQTFEVTHSFYE